MVAFHFTNNLLVLSRERGNEAGESLKGSHELDGFARGSISDFLSTGKTSTAGIRTGKRNKQSLRI